ncbi:MAG: hypothetical protein JXR83_15920 [Deltaproteobacteria bacterium]|nr:hypothetical protein [Deltaproteobacteria bacterium]
MSGYLFLLLGALAAVKPAVVPAPAAAAADKKKGAVESDRAAIEGIVKPFFAAVLAGEYSKAMEGLTDVFAIDEGKRGYLADQMATLEKKLGRAVQYERLGQRSLKGSRRMVTVYYVTYHPLKPAVWELVFYKPPASATAPERWYITSLRFESEKPGEMVEGIEP